jgi:hypothetical protein
MSSRCPPESDELTNHPWDEEEWDKLLVSLGEQKELECWVCCNCGAMGEGEVPVCCLVCGSHKTL